MPASQPPVIGDVMPPYMRIVEENETVIFDFDGTLVSKDTGYEFNKWLVQKSMLRTILMLSLFPVVGMLVTNSYTRKFGLNIGCFIATAFQYKSLFKLRSQFIHYYFNKAGAVAYAEGLDELAQHQREKRSVAIISGCPQWLLHGVVKHIGIENAKVIGSKLKVINGALLLKKHCYQANKLEMAMASGMDISTWIVGYSNSRADIPILRECSSKVLVNVPVNKLNEFRKHLEEPIQARVWA